jgi:gliding motility-associated-like protein
VLINIHPLINPILGNDTNICEGTSFVLNPGTSSNLNYAWTPSGNSPQINVSVSGKYKVRVSDGIGCFGDDSIFVNINKLPAVNITKDTVFCANGKQEITLFCTHTPASKIYWNNMLGSDSITIFNEGLYIAEVEDSNQCINSDSCMVNNLCKAISIKWPNVFTPDGDNINDFFEVFHIDDVDYQFMVNNIVTINIKIFDRWGIEVFNSSEILPKWDGKFNGNLCSPSTFYWIAKYSNSAGEKHELTGFVTSLY